MIYRFAIGSVVMFAATALGAAGDISEEETVRRETTAAGVILEYDGESAGQQEETGLASQDKAPAGAGRSVEFIVGGQAEDGVAKRKAVNVRK